MDTATSSRCFVSHGKIADKKSIHFIDGSGTATTVKYCNGKIGEAHPYYN